jgi:predicted lipoprotein with Yx(FWY)xxD motif
MQMRSPNLKEPRMTNIHLSGRRLAAVGGFAMLALAAVIAVIAMSANAASTTIGVRTVKVGSKAEPITVNSKGVALYTLSGDSAKHMKCTKANSCFSAWPPLTVHGNPTMATGVSGKLGTFKNSGVTQVTLSGHPMYTFAGDHNSPGVANGNGLKSFGGTWHVIVEGEATAARATSPSTRPSSGGGGW